MTIENIKFISDRWVVMLPLILMSIDFASGYIEAWKDFNVMSSKMRSGLVKKTAEIIEIIVVEVLGMAIGLPHEVVQYISAYICFTEVVSICENLAGMGAPMPEWIVNRITIEKEKMEKEVKK